MSEPLTRREKLIVVIATVVTAATRLMALSSTLWDWDEALFVLALREFDVALHHPHPPGFPLYILSAKIFQLLGMTEFHALQAVNFVAACAIVPVAFLFARALRFGFRTSLIASLFLAFFPNVWFFGGTAFSDVPSMVLVLAACVLLLNGHLVGGSIVLGLAAGFRPQNLLVGVVPVIVGCRGRRPTAILLSGAIVATTVATTYFAAAQLSGGWKRYAAAVAAHQRYILSTDAIGSPVRPPLRFLIDDFFVWPYRAPVINIIITVLVAVSLIAAIIRPRFGPWIAIATFAPLAMLSFLMLDWISASRFSIGYIALVAVLAADGLELAARRLQMPIALLFIALMFAWTIPLLHDVRTSPSPPVAAAEWIANHVRRDRLLVSRRLEAHARVLLPSRDLKVVDTEALPIDVVLDREVLLYREGRGAASSHNFARARGRLARVARDRYFEAGVSPVSDLIRLQDGWVQTPDAVRTDRQGSIGLAPVDGIARFSIVLRSLGRPASVALRFNGRIVDRYVVSPNGTARQYRLPSRARWNEVSIEADGTVSVISIGWAEVAAPLM